MSVDEGLELR